MRNSTVLSNQFVAVAGRANKIKWALFFICDMSPNSRGFKVLVDCAPDAIHRIDSDTNERNACWVNQLCTTLA